MPEQLECGSLLLHTYRIESKVFHGSRYDVWRVHHTGWNADLAMKRLSPEASADEETRTAFLSGCQSWIGLGDHPNIVPCYYVREAEGAPAVFSDWMAGGSLEECIREEKLYDGSDAEQQARLLDLTIQTARGLRYAHETGLIHGHIGTVCLLLTEDGQAKIPDFGLGDFSAASDCRSPEQLDGKPPTPRSDIYSWAACVLKMFLGMDPEDRLTGENCRSVFGLCRVDVPDALQRLLARCLETDPGSRPQGFDEICPALESLYRETTGRRYFRPAVRKGAVSPGALNNRALALLDLGKTDDAQETLEKARELDPADYEAAVNEVLIRWRKGQRTGGLFEEEMLQVLREEEKDDFLRAMAEERNAIAVLDTHVELENPTRALSSPDGRYIAANSLSRLKLHPFQDEKPLYEIRVDGLKEFCFSPDGQTIYALGDQSICYLDALTGEEKTRVLCPQLKRDAVSNSHIFLSADGGLLALLYKRPREVTPWLFVVDIAAEQPIVDTKAPELSSVNMCLLPSAEEAMILCHQDDIRCVRCSLRTGEVLQTYSLEIPHHVKQGYARVCAGNDGSFFVTGTSDGNVAVWRMSDGQLLRYYGQYYHQILTMTVLPGDETLLVSDMRQRLHAIPLAGPGPIQERLYKSFIETLNLMPDGSFSVFADFKVVQRLRFIPPSTHYPMRFSRNAVYLNPREETEPAAAGTPETGTDEPADGPAGEPEPEKKAGRKFSWRSLFGRR